SGRGSRRTLRECQGSRRGCGRERAERTRRHRERGERAAAARAGPCASAKDPGAAAAGSEPSEPGGSVREAGDPAPIRAVGDDDDDTVFAAMQAGARGYLLKGAEQEEIDRAIRAVVSGEAIFGPGVATRVLGYFAAPRPAPAEPFPELTAREREILDRMAAGR